MPDPAHDLSVALVVMLFSAGCGECVTTEYTDFQEVLADKAMERGWIPPFLPRSASEIEEQHDMNTNEFDIRFRLPASAVEGFVSDLEENGFAARDVRLGREPVCGSWKRDHAPALNGALAFSGKHVMGPAGRPSIWQRGDTVDVVIEPATGIVHYASR